MWTLSFKPDLSPSRCEAWEECGLVFASPQVQVRSMQLEQISVHGMRLERAREALAVLQDYAGEISN